MINAFSRIIYKHQLEKGSVLDIKILAEGEHFKTIDSNIEIELQISNDD